MRTVILVNVALALAWLSADKGFFQGHGNQKKTGRGRSWPPTVSAPQENVEPDETLVSCDRYSCADVSRCGAGHRKMLVHVGLDRSPGGWSREFTEVLEAVIDSDYYTEDPELACLFIPPVDLLDDRKVATAATSAGKALKTWTNWNGGENNLVFNMLPSQSAANSVPRGKAMLAGAGLSSHTYRPGFDVAIPTLSSSSIVQWSHKTTNQTESAHLSRRKWLVTSAQCNHMSEHRAQLKRLRRRHPDKMMLLGSECDKIMDSDHVDKRCQKERTLLLESATFCLMLPSALNGLTDPVLVDAMSMGCIPVIAVDSLVLPFSERLAWSRFSLRIYERQVEQLVDILSGVSEDQVQAMSSQLQVMYERHFSSMKAVALTTLAILNERFLPHSSRPVTAWNPNTPAAAPPLLNPLFMRYFPPSDEGFTAVILAYDRVESLMTLMARLSEVPSLAKMVVVWNNPDKEPPLPESFPQLTKPYEVVRTEVNLLSNRFFPHKSIETECVLSMDDDIIMLTADELEFGYRVWREFPDRIVGFPSRTHVWEQDHWRYESEWTNEVSMVLTGAAFYHSYWNYQYTQAPASSPTGQVREWADHNFNCEDIAMNFLVSNRTGKAPIKVGPRKKFRCSTTACENAGALSGIQSYMVERSDCLNLFAAKYGYMPLMKNEFRADPLLYNERMPDKMKHYSDMGSL